MSCVFLLLTLQNRKVDSIQMSSLVAVSAGDVRKPEEMTGQSGLASESGWKYATLLIHQPKFLFFFFVYISF